MNFMDEERLRWIKRNAARVVEISEGLGDFPFGYDERSVACLEDYIVRMRKRGDFFQHNCDALSDLIGCYLGEAMIARHGGEWHEGAHHRCSVRWRLPLLPAAQGCETDQERARGRGTPF